MAELSAVGTGAGGRLASLDVFRGVTIAAMILANNGAGHHVPWNGCSPTDWIMPFFFLIVGVSMPLSFASRRAKGATDAEMLRHTLRRSLIIFGLGQFLNYFPFVNLDLTTIRIPGVLVRIGFCYFFASLIVLKTSPRGQIMAAGIILVGYWVLMTLVPVPGFGAGVLSKDHPEANLAAYLDRVLMGRHLAYGNHDWDANGFLASWPAVVTMLFGARMGDFLRLGDEPREKVKGLAMGGAVLALAGWIWGGCPGFSSFLTLGEPRFGGPVFPINKMIWTSSYVLYTAGLGALALAVCYWVVDVRGKKAWAYPFTVLGSNAILAYMIAEMASKVLNRTHAKAAVLDRMFRPLGTAATANLLYAASYTLIIVCVMTVLYRKRVFWRV